MGLMDRDYMNQIPEEREAEHKSKMSEELKELTRFIPIYAGILLLLFIL